MVASLPAAGSPNPAPPERHPTPPTPTSSSTEALPHPASFRLRPCAVDSIYAPMPHTYHASPFEVSRPPWPPQRATHPAHHSAPPTPPTSLRRPPRPQGALVGPRTTRSSWPTAGQFVPVLDQDPTRPGTATGEKVRGTVQGSSEGGGASGSEVDEAEGSGSGDELDEQRRPWM